MKAVSQNPEDMRTGLRSDTATLTPPVGNLPAPSPRKALSSKDHLRWKSLFLALEMNHMPQAMINVHFAKNGQTTSAVGATPHEDSPRLSAPLGIITSAYFFVCGKRYSRSIKGWMWERAGLLFTDPRGWQLEAPNMYFFIPFDLNSNTSAFSRVLVNVQWCFN